MRLSWYYIQLIKTRLLCSLSHPQQQLTLVFFLISGNYLKPCIFPSELYHWSPKIYFFYWQEYPRLKEHWWQAIFWQWNSACKHIADPPETNWRALLKKEWYQWSRSEMFSGSALVPVTLVFILMEYIYHQIIRSILTIRLTPTMHYKHILSL